MGTRSLPPSNLVDSKSNSDNTGSMKVIDLSDSNNFYLNKENTEDADRKIGII